MRFHIILIISLFSGFCYSQATQNFDRYRLNKVSLSQLVNESSALYPRLRFTQPDFAEYMIKKIRQTLPEFKKEEKYKALLLTSDFFFDRGYYDSAAVLLDSARLIMPSEDPEFYSRLASSEYMRNRNVEAVNHYKKALSLFRTKKNYAGLFNTYIQLAEFYRKETVYSLSLNFLDSANVLKKVYQPSEEQMASYYNRYAAIAHEQGDKGNAERYTDTALIFARRSENLHMIALSLNEKAFLIRTRSDENLQISLDTFLLAEKIWEKIVFRRHQLSALANRIRLLINLNRYAEAKEAIAKGFSVLGKDRWLQAIRDFSELRKHIAIDEKDYKTAFEASELFFRAVIEEEQLTQQKELRELEFQFRVAAKDNEISSQQKIIALEKERNQEKDRTLKTLTILGLVILLALGAAAVFLFLLMRNRKRLIRQQEALNKSNNQLTLAFKNQEFLVREIHHRVKNNLNYIIAILEMQASDSSDETSGQLKDAVRRIESMAIVHELLYKGDNLSTISSADFITKLCISYKQLAASNSLPVQFKVHSDPVLLSTNESISLGIIFSELITNSIKHAFANTPSPEIELTLAYHADKNEISVTYTDNGCGVSERNSGSGLGTRLIDIFSRQLKGTRQSKKEQGFVFILNFPHHE